MGGIQTDARECLGLRKKKRKVQSGRNKKYVTAMLKAHITGPANHMTPSLAQSDNRAYPGETCL